MRVTAVGHATVLVEVDGVRLLTDPLLRDRITFLRAGARAREAALRERLDAVLVSNFHRDHFDPRSIAHVDPAALVVGPPGTAKRLARRGRTNVAELRPGESVDVRGVTVRATPALHGRMPERFRSVALGFLVLGSARLYFAGDTDLFPELTELASGRLDVALLPVGGWGPRLGAGHLDPQRAAEALRLIRPRIAVPIHFGVLRPLGFGRSNLSYLTQPGRTFARLAAETAPEVEIRLLDPGDSLDVTPAPSLPEEA